MFEAVIEITDKCPLSCLHCSTKASLTASHTLSLKDIQKVVSDGKRLGLDTVVISGGEPFSHPEFREIMSGFQNEVPRIKLYTSGITPIDGTIAPINPTDLAFLRQTFVSKLVVIFSVQGGSSDVHDSVTRIAGSFEILKESMNNAFRLNLEMELHFVPLKLNLHSLESVYDLAADYGISRLSLLRFVPQGRGAQFSDQLLLSCKERKELSEIIDKLKARNGGVQIRTGAPFNFLKKKGNICNVGQDRVLINPFGDIYPCEAFKQCVEGAKNIRNVSLGEAFNESEIFIQIAEHHENRRRQIQAGNSSHEDRCSGCLAQSYIHTNRLSFKQDPFAVVS